MGQRLLFLEAMQFTVFSNGVRWGFGLGKSTVTNKSVTEGLVSRLCATLISAQEKVSESSQYLKFECLSAMIVRIPEVFRRAPKGKLVSNGAEILVFGAGMVTVE